MEEITMKKILPLLLALLLCLSVAACGSQAPSAPSTSTSPAAESAKPSPAATEDKAPEASPKDTGAETSAKPKEEAAYEVTYSKARMWDSGFGSTYLQTIVEITNTGTVPLYLSSGSYDLETADGDLVTSQSMVSMYPSVLDVGEKGYMYDETIFDEGPVDDLVVIPRIKAEKSKVDLVRYNVTDVKLSDDQFFGIKALGRVENTTDADDDMPEVAIVLYNSDGEPVGILFTFLDELASGDKMGFEASGISLPDEITSDYVADTLVYAYPIQFQF